jgi:DNA replication protein DnaC
VSRAFFESVHADPWSQDFLDLTVLNARATEAIEDAIERVRRTARAQARALRSTSIVILGPPGAGKTHLFARLRRKLGPRGVFVLSSEGSTASVPGFHPR